ncbi:MAG TPA: formate--tetrahydrofolate ligase [Actinomycetaceae bacterium]|nr:formate--tetrahydrofolate ligase [Actinomycetaceae bacterium]
MNAIPRPILEIAESAGIDTALLETHGPHVAKLPIPESGYPWEPAPLIDVTAVTPTPLGEGKTTTAIGLAQGLKRIGKRPILTLRQPSLGPTFGIKGGASGAGKSEIIPSEMLNLHLTGDFHAVTAAHNMLAAMVDNHLHHGNALGIDERTITWPRVLDVNDRALRHIVVGLGTKVDGVTRQASFDITAASEVMTILALARDLQDLRARLARIVVGYTFDGRPVTAEDLKAAGAMAVLLRDALRPNLMQTTEGVPTLIHTGPFGNIATGNSSVVADRMAGGLGDMVITESGFGADLGAERLVNLKSRFGLSPALAVVVVTVRSLKAHSGRYRIVPGKPLPTELLEENVEDVAAGIANLDHHLRTIKQWGIPAVVAINAFPDDHASEHALIADHCLAKGVPCAVSTHVADGGAGAEDLAQLVVQQLEKNPKPELERDYELDAPLERKIASVARRVYGAQGIAVAPAAARELRRFTDLGYGGLPVVIAKTHLSITHEKGLDPASEWTLPIREVRLAAGAGYVYALAGAMSTMPGLPSHPNAENIDLDGTAIVGLF